MRKQLAFIRIPKWRGLSSFQNAYQNWLDQKVDFCNNLEKCTRIYIYKLLKYEIIINNNFLNNSMSVSIMPRLF